ncbi:two-component regulator propeller domain-containing protein [Empedobacter falsenii]|uniref:T9SS type A sorting domain-containing protein n=1 Tax=Empedobacter falsenii TaxID=343874 RepID=A0AAW7DKN2_9FLAO|nr:two-component regulator propeller domain-containing protein [Empedobacter falsenii]MDM1552564.1 T9SS type A sorting domain-containing protein [Empedobacter falsenii]
MKTKLFIFITMIFTSLNAQNDKVRWADLFSYNNVKLLEEVNGVIYCGTENGIFLFNPQNPTSDWIKLNKTNFLNNVGVSAMAYDKDSDSFLVGYENGGLDLLKSGESTMVLDIKWNGFSGDKKVNHIFINDGIAFISGAFGIVSYDLKEEEFKETTRTTAIVNDAAILNNKLYIATTNGIYSSELTSKKLNNPNINSWMQPTFNQNVTNIELFENEIYYSVNNELKTLNGFSATYNLIEELKSSNGQLIVTQNNQVSILNGLDYPIIDEDGNEINFNSGIFINNIYFGGSVNHGIINLSNHKEFYPQGPYSNKSFSVSTSKGKVWIAPGGMESFNNLTFNADGFSYYDTKNWTHYSSDKDLNGAKDIIKIAVDPTNDSHFMVIPYAEVTGWGGTQIGIFEFSSNKIKPNHITSPLPQIYRFGGGNFDDLGNFYLSESWYCDAACMASGTPNYSLLKDNVNSISVRNASGSWMSEQRTNQNSSNALSPIIDNKYIYIPQARLGGVAVLRKGSNETVGSILRSGEQTLPSNDVWSAALDKSGNLWIGTGQGLAVTYGIESAIDNKNLTAEPIVIIQDGIPEALLTDVGIYAIKVDNANNKWIATNGAGAYYVSDSGESTKLHFTSKNSPLPSDIVYDVSIDESTGKVFFATEKGVVSYNGDVSTEANNFNNAIAYPNPYRPEYKGNVTIKNLPNRALVKITDIVGNLLFEKKAEGGIVEWNTNNAKGKPVASGIYLVLMTNADGTETKTLKIAVVR